MSYAAVAAHNAPPSSQQPKPDAGLLNTDVPSYIPANDAAKVNVVAPDFKTHPTTVTSESEPLTEVMAEEAEYQRNKDSAKRKVRIGKEKAREGVDKAEEEGIHLWEVSKSYLLQPGVAGGLFGVVNVGLLSWATYALYSHPPLRRDARFLGTAAATAAVLLGAEGYAAERYSRTPRGAEEKRRAKLEGAAVYRHSREAILRPGVLGGLLGVVNVGVLGTVGYFAYTNWDAPRWDRRIVSAVSVGLLALWGGEGFLAEQSRERYH